MEDITVKTAIEIGHLAGQLTPINQALVLNSITTLLYAQESIKKITSDPQAERYQRSTEAQE